MRLIILVLLSSSLYCQNEVLDRLNAQSERIFELEMIVSELQDKVNGQNQKINQLSSQRKSSRDKKRNTELAGEIEVLRGLVEDTQKTLALTKDILSEETQRRKEAEERGNIAVDEARRSVIAAESASYSANQAARGRDQAIKDTKQLVSNGNGFNEIFPYNQRGKIRGGTVKLTVTPEGRKMYEGYKSGGKVDFLYADAIFRLMNSSLNDNLEHIRGYICIYDPSTQEFLSGNSMVLTLFNKGLYYKTYKGANPFLRLSKELSLKGREGFVYMYVAHATYNKKGFKEKTASEVCLLQEALFCFPQIFCESTQAKRP